MDRETEDEFVLMKFLAMVLLMSASWVQARQGVIQFSDGNTIEGNITLTPGKQFQFLDGKGQKAFGLERLREIRFVPEEETMERKWRFPDAGQARKEFTGQPYPIRHLRATVVLADNTPIQGHLFTTVLYVEGATETRKVILFAKQRGEEGTTLQALVYPALIRFNDETTNATALLHVTAQRAGAPARGELNGVAIGSLVRLDGRHGSEPGGFELPAPLGEELLLGLRDGNNIVMGWPKGGDEKIVTRVREGLKDAQDFFDERQLIGVYYDEPAGNIYSLLLLVRRGNTTLGGDKTQPWRVSVWRWKYDPETNQLMLAGRCDVFRDIIARDGQLPTVRPSEKLWQPKIENKTITVAVE
jgi:hypothetical protein